MQYQSDGGQEGYHPVEGGVDPGPGQHHVPQQANGGAGYQQNAYHGQKDGLNQLGVAERDLPRSESTGEMGTEVSLKTYIMSIFNMPRSLLVG